jgi:peptidoglycan/xylan/chitin deacetylase (PgdA/CDA1 family)
MSLARTLGFTVAGLTMAGVCAVVLTAPDWVVDQLADRYPGCIYRVRTQQRLLALTFDDGPDPKTTPKILAQLRRYGARATFFLIADKVPGHEELVRAMVRDGHELGNHFTQDRPSIRLDSAEFEHDLLEAHRTLTPFAHVHWARPASGWYSQQMIAVMQQNGYECALASVYPFDVAIPSASWATRYVLRTVRPGRIVVLHDGGARGFRTAQVLGRILPGLRRRGYRFVSLSELTAAEG